MKEKKLNDVEKVEINTTFLCEDYIALQCIALLIETLIGAKKYINQILTIYSLLYPEYSITDVFRQIVEDNYRMNFDLYERSQMLAINKNEDIYFLNMKNGDIYMPACWVKSKTKLPSKSSYYLTRSESGYFSEMIYDIEFQEKGWNHFFDGETEKYIKVEQWCDLSELKKLDINLKCKINVQPFLFEKVDNGRGNI